MEPLPRSPGGFISSLFDFSFRELITPKVIRVLYILIVVLIGIGSLAAFASFATQGAMSLILGIVVVPLVALLYIILARVYMEILIVIFRIGEDVADIADRGTL